MNSAAPEAATIISLAKEVEDKVHSFVRRVASVNDALSSTPETNGESCPNPNDLHGLLQRTLTNLINLGCEVDRLERIIGVCPMEPANVTPVGSGPGMAAYRR